MPIIKTQSIVTLPLYIEYSGNIIEPNKAIYSEYLDDSISFSTIKFYIGNSVSKTNEASYQLIDFTDSSLENLGLELNKNNQYEFCLGVEPRLSKDGAHGGDLDPANGMYWSWQSGYINAKIEGILGQKEFTYHLGGYLEEENTFQAISIQNNGEQSISLDLENFINYSQDSDITHVMSPGKEAVELSNQLAKGFNLK